MDSGRVPKVEYVTQNTQQPLNNSSLQNVSMLSQKDEDKMPLFLIKLWNIVEDPSYQNIICWDETGYSFHIVDPYSFCRNVLPHYFKHNNLNSLIRQLNMYGFRKVSPLDKGGLTRSESDQDHLEFSHIHFVRGRPDLMVNIKRRQTNRAADNNASSAIQVQTQNNLTVVMEELRQLREKQRNMDVKMCDLTKENEALWDQLDHVRQQHTRQQQVVNKLVQFLVAIVQPNMSKRVLKRGVLAIDEPPSKRPRAATENSNNLVDMLDRLQREIIEGGGLQQQKGYPNDRGPIIADVTDEVYSPSARFATGINDSHANSPSSSDQMRMYSTGNVAPNASQKKAVYNDPTSYQQSANIPAAPIKTVQNQPENNQIAQNYAPTLQMSPGLERQISQELQDYLNGMDTNIDSCRDLLGGNWDFDLFENIDDDPEHHDRNYYPQLALEQAPPPTNVDFLGGTPEVGAHIDLTDPPMNLAYPPPDDAACTTPTLLTPCTSPPYQ